MQKKKERHIGPHVIEPTPETHRVYFDHKDLGHQTIWSCKYCDWTGSHPSLTPINIGIQKDCDGIEWLDSELEAFKKEFCSRE